jgi:ribosomal protein L40E
MQIDFAKLRAHSAYEAYMNLQEKCPTCGATHPPGATSCPACGSALNNQEPSLNGKPSPSCPDEEVVLEIAVLFFPPEHKWLATHVSPLRITTNYLCFSGSTIKGDTHDIVIRLADITRIYEEEWRQVIKTPTLVIESGGDKFRFFVTGKGTSTMGGRSYGTKGLIRRRTNNLISFITTQIDLMSRTGRPLTKDEITQAYRQKYPERLTTGFKAHLVIYVVVNLLLLGFLLATIPEMKWQLYLNAYLIVPLLWGAFVLLHYWSMRTVFVA